MFVARVRNRKSLRGRLPSAEDAFSVLVDVFSNTMDPPAITCIEPSQAQLALAIAIVNAKPAAVPVIDHINDIRSHIRNSRSHPISPDFYKYFDSVAFWKNAYTKAEDEQSKLNNRIYELEQRVESLKGKLQDGSAKSTTTENGKRNASKELSASEPRGKRQKTNGAVVTGLEQLDDAVSRFRSEEAVAGSLLRYSLTLQQDMRKKPNWAVLCANTIHLCKAAEAAVTWICIEEIQPKQKPTNRDPIAVLAVIEEAHKLVCQSINKMLRSNEGQKYEGHTTYHAVAFFKATLLAIDKQCRSRAIQHEKTRATPKTKSTRATETTCHATAADLSAQIRHLVASMLLTCTTVVTRYENLLEGYLFVLLRRVGTVLSAIEFREMLSNAELQTSEAKLPMPGGLARAASDAVSLQAAHFEATHLAWLLEKAVALVYSLSMKSTFNISDTSKPGQTKNEALLRFTKKKMQRTLLKAVFREDEPLFLDSLKRPQPAKVTLAETEDETEPEWFSREVWRLLGWDILESIWE